ncbi:N(6)-adenine-specific methyltransferase METTL4 isoform X4 [Phascolarctos cinereus]|uniref:Methyltransferase-like protein 4 isoform X4 n=1 Tax=Phascolarctos cinereus TaxID=38626 RepID=A0A6P5IW38_PHACI|nr:methyltransferase-like protein 4 isoform X4 [Phascolarctos cinereus]
MSVVHQLSSGWLLDHLAFINNIDYQLCQHHEPTSSNAVPISSPHCGSLTVTSTSSIELSATLMASETATKPGTDEREKNKALLQKYTFRAELFHVTKPHVTTSDCTAFQQENKDGNINHEKPECVKDQDSVSAVRKKGKRSIAFNQGELDAMEYHAKVRGLILDGTTQLIQEGLKSGFLYSVSERLDDDGKKYDVIVIDPPWQNKSVKRSKRYNYLSSWQIKQIPVPKLAAPNCLVITWVTNRQKHLQFVKDELYPYWSVETLTEWHWVKITRSGEFVFPLDSPHKKPYEGLVLGRIQGKTVLPLRNPKVKVLPIPDHKLIVSVPCTLHSHKPPLTEVLKDYIMPDAECLELFARNLQPGWTSWGNEVLKFQHIDYFITPQIRN